MAESLAVRVAGLGIDDMIDMPIAKLYPIFENSDFGQSGEQICVSIGAREKNRIFLILKEIKEWLFFLYDVGLGYLSLGRDARTISGGEAQRIRIASQIGSGLTGVMYVIDEPSIGLHERDTMKLIRTLRSLQKREHRNSRRTRQKDDRGGRLYHRYLGPDRKIRRQVVFAGTLKELVALNTETAKYLNGGKKIEYFHRRP